MKGYGPLNLPIIDDRDGMLAAVHEIDLRRREMLELRDNMHTAAGLARWEAACRAYAVEEGEAIRRARRRADSQTGKQLLATLAIKIRDGDRLSHAAREFLCEVMLAAIQDPRGAGQALGIVNARGKKRSATVEARNVVLALAVRRFVAKGATVSSGVDCAIGKVAVEFGENESTVRDAHAAYRKTADFILSWEAQDTESLPKVSGESNTD